MVRAKMMTSTVPEGTLQLHHTRIPIMKAPGIGVEGLGCRVTKATYYETLGTLP